MFEAAYERACEEVMFSKEAIDLTLPYLARQLNTYVAACATMAEVYSAQVAVYGESAVLQSRTDMSLRLTGCDLKGNKVQKSVLELYEDYFGRDKFIFVNKSNNTNVKLNTEIKCVDHYAKQMLNQRDPYTDAGTPDFMKNNPLSASQVKDLAKYCGEKNITLFEFLFNRIGFKPTGMKDNIIVYVPGSTTIQVPTLVTVPEEWSFEMVELTVDEMVVRMDSAINDWNVKIKELEEKETKTEAETLRLERFKEELQTLKDQKEGLKNGTVKVTDIWLVGY